MMKMGHVDATSRNQAHRYMCYMMIYVSREGPVSSKNAIYRQVRYYDSLSVGVHGFCVVDIE